MSALIPVLRFVLEWFSTMKINSETSAWKPCPRDKTYIRPPVFPICLPWLIISPENFLAWQFFTSHEHTVNNPVQSLNNMSHDSAIPHAVYASQLCRSVCPIFLSKLCIHAIKTDSQHWLVGRLCIIEGLRVTHWVQLQTITQVRRKGYSSTTTDLLFSVVVPVEFSGSQEICLIPSFVFVCNPGSSGGSGSSSSSKTWENRWMEKPLGVPLRQIFPD